MRFIINDNRRLSDAIQYIAGLPDKTWQIDVKEYKPNRSNSQNNLLWMWYEVISAYTGDTKEELHDKFKTKFLGVVEKEIVFRDESGEIQTEILRRPRSTTTLTTKEFTEFLEKIELTVMAAFPGFILPKPDDYKYAMGGPK